MSTLIFGVHYLKTNSSKKSRDRNRRKLYVYLTEHPCVDCGEDDPIVLQFDHIRGVKSRNISRMVNNAMAWYSILLEIQKCEVVCANCHSRRTAKAQKWYSSLVKTSNNHR